MNFPHKRLNRPISFLFYCLPILFGCQLTSLLENTAAPPAEPAPTVEILPTRSTATQPADPAPTNPPAEPDNPTPTSPALPPTETAAITDNTDSIAADNIVFVSPGGYQLSHPNSWVAADYFGQTAVTNNAAALDNGSALIDQPMLLIAAGSADGQTAVTILNNVQQELLGDGKLVPISPVLPISSGEAKGMKSTQRLNLPEGALEITTMTLVQGELYVTAVGMIPENTPDTEVAQIEEIIESIQLNSDQYKSTAADYELSAEQITEMNQDLAALRPIPEESLRIDLGETQATLKPADSLAFEFMTDGVNPLNLRVSPDNTNFDLTLDLVDSLGNTILPAGKLLDNGRAGEAESINGLQLAAGSYRIIVRGFGFTGGPFTVSLSNS